MSIDPPDGYYEIKGLVKLMRTRRRRLSSGASGIVDISVSAAIDDGDSRTTPSYFSNSGTSLYCGSSSTTGVNTFERFLGITIPQGATIDVAYMTCKAKLPVGTATKANIYCEDADTAVSPTTQGQYDAVSLTTDFAVWDDDILTDGVIFNTPSLVDPIQEVINRGSWASGNALMIMTLDDGSATGNGGNYYRWYAEDDATEPAPAIHIEWSS